MKSVLIINSYNIGNTLLKTPLMQALHSEGFTVDIITDQRPILGGDIHELLEGQPYLRHVFPFNPMRPDYSFRKNRYDLIIASIPNDTPFTLPILNILIIDNPNAEIIFHDNPETYTKHEVKVNLDLISAPYKYHCKIELNQDFIEFPTELIRSRLEILT